MNGRPRGFLSAQRLRNVRERERSARKANEDVATHVVRTRERASASQLHGEPVVEANTTHAIPAPPPRVPERRRDDVSCVTMLTSSGRMSPACPRSGWMRGPRRCPSALGLTRITLTPRSTAAHGSDAAGCTRRDVPTDRKTSHSRAALQASASAFSGSASPNQMTSGRSGAPHRGRPAALRDRPPTLPRQCVRPSGRRTRCCRAARPARGSPPACANRPRSESRA